MPARPLRYHSQSPAVGPADRLIRRFQDLEVAALAQRRLGRDRQVRLGAALLSPAYDSGATEKEVTARWERHWETLKKSRMGEAGCHS